MKRTWVILVVFAVAGGGALLLAGNGSHTPQPAGLRTTTQPVATAPTTHAAEVYPSRQLADECQKVAKELQGKLDDTFNVVVEPPFVVAGNMRAPLLKAHVQGSVIGPAQAMWNGYLAKKPDKVITVLLFTDNAVRPVGRDTDPGYAYRRWARQLFGDTDVSYYGYYKPDKETMVMNIDTGGGTLVHELTHALIVYDFPDPPAWFNEGLGSLHEQCSIGKDDITGLENWRLPDLQEAIKAGKLRPLKDLVTKDDFRGKGMGLNYAQARYFLMYMQHEDKLKAFYAYYRDHHKGNDAAVKAIEHIMGHNLADVEKAYLEWGQTLSFPPVN